MKILILNFILSTHEKGVITRRRSNYDTMIYNLCRGFVALGHEVTLLASEEYRPLEEERNPFEVVYFRSLLPAVFKPSVLPWPKGLRKYLKKNAADFDHIIASEVFSIPTAILATVDASKPVIWHELSAYQKFARKIPARIWYNLVAPALMKKITVVPRSVDARDFVSRFLPRVSDVIIDHGANGDIFYPGDSPEDRFIVISQLIERKRIDRIIERFSRFISDDRYSHFKLDIVGDGPAADYLREFAREHSCRDNVIFHGRLRHEEFAPIGRKARAMLVYTSQDLNMVSVPEAIVNGTPVLMNTVPATASFVNERRLGIAKEDWGPEELAQMVNNYDEYHSNCCKIRESLTAKGAASRFVDVFNAF